MQIKELLGKTVLVKHIKKEVSDGGLLLVDTQQGATTVMAEVLMIGRNLKSLLDGSPLLKAGDKVLVPFHLGTRIEDKVLYDIEDVIAVL